LPSSASARSQPRLRRQAVSSSPRLVAASWQHPGCCSRHCHRRLWSKQQCAGRVRPSRQAPANHQRRVRTRRWHPPRPCSGRRAAGHAARAGAPNLLRRPSSPPPRRQVAGA
jgi:hypothetical protein